MSGTTDPTTQRNIPEELNLFAIRLKDRGQLTLQTGKSMQ
jgi:hypothetical protein